MKNAGLLLLAALLCLGAYGLGSLNARKVIELPPVEWAQHSDAAQAWREFTVSLEAAAARIYQGEVPAPEQTEGLQYLSQLAAASLEMKLARGDREVPQFTDWMSDYRRFLGDSPDAIYHTAEISHEYRYRISGNRGAARYLGFMLYGRQLNGWNRAAANLSSASLRFDEQGDFSILLSAEPPADGQDWLQLEEDVHMVMVRQYYHERKDSETARFSIRNLDAAAVPAPMTDAVVAERLRAATGFFNATVDGAVALADMLADAPNTTEPPARYSADFGGVFYPTFDNQYFGGWFKLAADEALVIEGEVPDAPYWSVSLQNRWLQSLGGSAQQSALNDQQIVTANGRYRLVVSHVRPPGENWLDTGGREQGLVAIRYQLAADSEPPQLRVVKLDAL